MGEDISVAVLELVGEDLWVEAYLGGSFRAGGENIWVKDLGLAGGDIWVAVLGLVGEDLWVAV